MRLDAATPSRRRVLALTSLVDVVFILLFFFMLAAREAPPQALALTLGDASSAGSPSPRVAQLTVLGHGQLQLDGVAMPVGALVPALRAGAREQVQLRVASAAQLQDLVDVLAPLHAARIGVDLRTPVP